MTAKCLPEPYIESMIWATDSVGMQLLLYKHHGDNRIGASGVCDETHGRAIYDELEATKVIKQAGYKVEALMADFHKSETYEKHCEDNPLDRIQWNEEYCGVNIHPYETIFTKADHYADRGFLGRLEDLHESRVTNGSWDVCRRGGLGE